MKPGSVRNVVIMGAAGRDFHDFNMCFRDNPDCRVVAFTATQIPDIEDRIYPAALAGTQYPDGIPIRPEDELTDLIRAHQVHEVVFSYSDVTHEYVMHKASTVIAAGADFRLLGPTATALRSSKPVVAICAVRTGCGKSQTTRKVSQYLKELGKRIAVVRHPMPYGDLTRQICQRFGELADLDRHECTIEEREEYEPHIRAGNVVFAGIDYEKILRAAEQEADVVIWDGGNNDRPFFVPNLHIVVADPHRPGHELRYHPGESNLRMADLVIINKVDTAPPAAVEQIEQSVRQVNPRARVLRAESPVTADDTSAIKGRRVLLVEDGPTLTHGEMSIGAAHVLAQRCGAAEIVDPRPYAQGSIRDVFQRWPQTVAVLPAMGYGRTQMNELEATINKTPCDLVLVGTPIDLPSLLKLNKPAMRVYYHLHEQQPELLKRAISEAVQ